jgi:hypothetical protein
VKIICRLLITWIGIKSNQEDYYLACIEFGRQEKDVVYKVPEKLKHLQEKLTVHHKTITITNYQRF